MATADPTKTQSHDTAPTRLSADPNAYTRGLTGVNQVSNFAYVNALIIFFAALCAAAFFARLWKIGINHLRHLFATGPGREKQALFARNQNQWWPWIKRYVLYAPPFHTRHNLEIRLSSSVTVGTLPSRFHMVILMVYVVSNIAYCADLDYKGQPKAAVVAELRGRAGSLAVFNLIPCTLFALRNNPLIPLLQVSYDTFNLLHRWTARIILLEVLCHGGAWIANYVDGNGWAAVVPEIVSSSFFSVGAIAILTFALINIQSLSPIRHAFYESFFTPHRLLAALAIGMVFAHMTIDDLPQKPYLVLSIILWGLEGLIRFCTVWYYNFSRSHRTKALVEMLPNEAVRLTFELARPWKFKPGTHAHVYFGGFHVPSLLSSHPFTIAWSEDKIVRSGDEKLPVTEFDLDHKDNVRTSISMVVRAREGLHGLTPHLYNRAASAPNGRLEINAAVEGPYGGHESLDSYGTVLLFAGGVGITHQISYMRHLISGCDQATVATRKILLIWSVPNTESLEWVRPWMDEILKMKGRREVLRIMLFVTKPKSRQEVHSGTGTVQMFPGRCNPQTIIDKEIVERIGAMMITVCGPGGFADSVRAAARRRVQIGAIDFVEEAYTY